MTSVYMVMAVWMPTTVVLTSCATVAMETFMTELSSVIRNWADASVMSTVVDTSAVSSVPTAMAGACHTRGVVPWVSRRRPIAEPSIRRSRHRPERAKGAPALGTPVELCPFRQGRRERESRGPGRREERVMTEHKSFKRLVRGRMAKTGESYTAARAQLLAGDEAAAVVAEVLQFPCCEEPLREQTGRGWGESFEL